MSRPLVAGLFVAVSALALAASAQDAGQNVQVHGFGSWAFGDTDGNRYLAGEPEREYRNTTLGLAVDSSPSDRLRVIGQAFWTETDQGTSAEFDYAFAEWRFSDSLRLRAGQVKMPFGIYSEIARIGTLRPFLDLPQAVYGPIGLTGEHYRGVGLTGRHTLGADWALSYDAYGGGMILKEFGAPETFILGEPIGDIEVEESKDIVGGRLVLETPVEGLRVGSSAYTGHEVGSNRRTVYGAHAEYAEGPWILRTEYAHETVKDDLKVNGFYLEGAYHIDPRWQVAARYDHLTSEVFGVPSPDQPSLLDHKEVTVGLSYWFSPAFTLRVDYHHVDGNRFAAPDLSEFVETIESGRLRAKTRLVQFGAQFSF